MTITAGVNEQDLTSTPLLGGDLNSDDQINNQDVDIIKTNFGKSNQSNFNAADINYNKRVGMDDIGFLINNWQKIGEAR